MNLFARPEYESEFTLFLQELKQRDPSLQEKQNAGRALLWDKAPIDLDEQRRLDASKLKPQAYTYK